MEQTAPKPPQQRKPGNAGNDRTARQAKTTAMYLCGTEAEKRQDKTTYKNGQGQPEGLTAGGNWGRTRPKITAEAGRVAAAEAIPKGRPPPCPTVGQPAGSRRARTQAEASRIARNAVSIPKE